MTLSMCLSRILLMTGRIYRYSLQFAGFSLSPDFGIGTTRANFQSLGTLLVLIERLKSLERLGVIECAVFFSIRAEMSSAPVDFLLPT